MSDIILPIGDKREAATEGACNFLRGLDKNIKWKCIVKRYRKARSDQQNNYLWGVCYETIMDSGMLEGWTKKDLHEFFCGEHFGWQEFYGFGRRKIKPVRTTTRNSDGRRDVLSTTEFMDFVAFIQQFMAEKGVFIPDPDEEFDSA